MNVLFAGLFFVSLYVPSAMAADPQLILDILVCESGLKHDADGDSGKSRGIAQFRKETFYEFLAMAKKQGAWPAKKMGKPNWLNPQQQLFLLEWGLDNGYGDRWSCYRKLTEENEYTQTP